MLIESHFKFRSPFHAFNYFGISMCNLLISFFLISYVTLLLDSCWNVWRFVWFRQGGGN